MGFFGGKKHGADLYVDLGTANTLVVSRSKGIVVNEPSVIAYYEDSEGHKRIVAVGEEAKLKIGKTPGNLVAGHPLRDGVIAELDIAEQMLRYFIERAQTWRLKKPRVVVSLPYGVTDIEKKAVRDAGLAAGAAEVLLIDEPMAAAMGADLPVHQPQGNMVIDIGGGTTEIALISLYGIVHCEAVRVGGHKFDRAIVQYIRRHYNLIVGDQSAERLKITLGSALPGGMGGKSQIRGVDFVSGLPRSIEITSAEVSEALESDLNIIFEAARRTLEQAPPDLVPDIIKHGVVVAGGGALLHGMEERLMSELNVPVRIATDPLLTIALGGQRAIQDADLLERITL